MDLKKIALVQATFKRLQPRGEIIMGLFYSRLFELDPALKGLFQHNIKQQEDRFFKLLGLAIAGLDRPQTIIPTIKALGRRHIAYGVRPEHYHTVGRALLWALEQESGEAFTPQLHAAWTEAYYVVAGLMKEAADQELHKRQHPLTLT